MASGHVGGGTRLGGGVVWAGAGLVSGRLQLLGPARGLAIRGLLAQPSCPVFEDCRQVSAQSPDRGRCLHLQLPHSLGRGLLRL